MPVCRTKKKLRKRLISRRRNEERMRKTLSNVSIPGIGLCLVAMSGKLRPVNDIVEYLKTTVRGRKEPFSDMNPDSRYGIAVTQDIIVYPIYGDGKLGLPDTNEFITFLYADFALHHTVVRTARRQHDTFSASSATCLYSVTLSEYNSVSTRAIWAVVLLSG